MRTSSLDSSFIRFLASFSWTRISTPPRWVEKKAPAFYNRKSVRPYDKIIYFKGKNFKYKVFFKMIAQGQIDIIYYAKKK